MGIKMNTELDSAGIEMIAETYSKGKGMEPLRCSHCPVHVTHQSAHTRERDDKPYLVSAYFRLLPGGHHAEGCKHAISDKVKSIANESTGLFESIRNGQYRLRLVMIRDALAELSKKASKSSAEAASGSSKTFESSRGKLPAYINSAKRVLQLRALCDEDEEIASYLELIFEGNTTVPWSQFYFETERHLDAYRNAVRNTVQHPIALHGTVKSTHIGVGKNRTSNVLNLTKNKYLADANDPEIGIGVEASVWCDNADWLAKLNPGDEVVVFGMWKAKAGEISASSKPEQYRFKSFITHKLSLWPVLATQITRVA